MNTSAVRVVGIALAASLLVCSSGASAQRLYDETTYRALAADHKAFRVGDVVTVQVYEQSSATTTTDTTTQRNNAVNVGISSAITGTQRGGSIAQGGSFDGGGTTQRANKLLVTLSVSVVEVLPNGDLRLAGDQALTVNEEHHAVHLEGRVRPQDVAGDNTVLSTRLADAHVNYVGAGDLSERQKPSWWRKLLDGLGL
jgi:flagellar L-ring protein precursor FlgH